jgi:hypothetical protein
MALTIWAWRTLISRWRPRMRAAETYSDHCMTSVKKGASEGAAKFKEANMCAKDTERQRDGSARVARTLL